MCLPRAPLCMALLHACLLLCRRPLTAPIQSPPACPCCSEALLQQCGIALPWQTSTGTMAAAGPAGGAGAAGVPVAVPQSAGQAAAVTKPATQTKPGEAGGAATRACSGYPLAAAYLACLNCLPAAVPPQAAPRRMPKIATSMPTTTPQLRSAWNAMTSACAAARAPPPPSAEHSTAHRLSVQHPALGRRCPYLLRGADRARAAICIALACSSEISAMFASMPLLLSIKYSAGAVQSTDRKH